MELYNIKTEYSIEGACESGIGGRSENQDSYGYQDTPFGLLVTVCDGMGGGPSGKTASSIAVNEIIASVMEAVEGTAPMEVVEAAIRRANRAIIKAVEEKPQLQGMGTTCTVVLINEVSAIVAHVGDSRVYQLRGHYKVFRTFDHSLVFEMVRDKVITEEQARLSEQSNIITRALGLDEELEIDMMERPYLKGDRFMLCSDGIHGTMPEKDLIAKVTQRDNVGYIVDKLVHEVDEKGIADGGLHDNLTLVLMEMKTRSKLKEKMKNKTTLVLGIIAAILAIIALVLNSCKNKEIDVESFQIATEQVHPGVDTVGIIGTYDFSIDVESMTIIIGCDSTLIDANSHVVTLTGKDYAVTVKNLKPNTTYYYTYSVSLGLVKDFTIPNKRFTTLKDGYNIIVASSPSQGTVTGGGRYNYGQNCTVRATANEGFKFISWTENGMIVSFDSVYSFSVSRDRFLDANFSPTQGFVITTISNPGQGIVSGGGIYYEGQTCTLRAVPNEGYYFLNWTENDSVVSMNSEYSFTVTRERTLEANFTTHSPENYNISVSANPNNGGTITGGGTYQQGQSCTVKATANAGYTFVNWTENGNQVCANANYTFTVSGNRTLVANFTAASYVITANVDPEGSGTVIGAGGYEYGQSCTLRAIANSGYSFTKWTENGNQILAGANYTFTVTGNRNLVACFTANSQNYTINVSANPTNGGSVSGGGIYLEGQTCMVYASAYSGFTFGNWTENGNSGQQGTWIVDHLDRDFTGVTGTAYTSWEGKTSNSNAVYAGQSAGGNESIQLRSNNNNSGIITTASGGIVGNITITWNNNTPEGRTLNVYGRHSAYTSPTELYSLDTQGVLLGAIVKGTSTELEITDSYEYLGLRSASGAMYLSEIDVTWKEEIVSTNASYSFTVTGNRNLVANFSQQAPQNFLINVSASPSNGGTVSGAGTYQQGQSCTLRAVANGGYTFSKWTENGTQVSTNANYTFSVTGNRTLVAVFTTNPQSYTIGVSANPSNGGYVSGGGTYQQGQSCTVHAVANNGYSFSKWTENGTQVSSNAYYTFTVTGNRTLVAHFTANPPSYTISVSANPNNGGYVSGGGIYQQGQTCTVHAIANSGYTFSKWTENGTQVSTNPNYSFTVAGNRTLVAHFTANPQNYTITVSANPTNGGTVSGGGTYLQGQSCTVLATANSGYTFSNWTENGNVVSTNASYTFIVTDNRNLLAYFQQTVSGDTFSVNFDDGQIPAGWTTIDANNDGYNWVLGSQVGGIYLVSGASLEGSGHNSSTDLICSGSYSNVTSQAITPDNYLVSPQVTLVAGSTFSFWACAQDASYAAEHFGVFVSDNGTSDWTMVQEWTMTAKSGGEMSIGRGGETRAQGTWRQYTVDLSAFAGQKYIAIRHFNCTDMFILDVDDIVLSNAKK